MSKTPCRELVISTQDKSSASIIQWKLHFPALAKASYPPLFVIKKSTNICGQVCYNEKN